MVMALVRALDSRVDLELCDEDSAAGLIPPPNLTLTGDTSCWGTVAAAVVRESFLFLVAGNDNLELLAIGKLDCETPSLVADGAGILDSAAAAAILELFRVFRVGGIFSETCQNYL